MKRLIFAAFLLATPAWAQAPQEVTASNTLDVRVNQTRTFQFDYAVSKIVLSNKGVAEVLPESDRTVNIRGLAQGETLMTVYDRNDRVAFRTSLAVLQAGGYVKIYGQNGSTARTKDFNSYFCTEHGCGRADSDLGPQTTTTTISDTVNKPDGSSQTISREYR